MYSKGYRVNPLPGEGKAQESQAETEKGQA